MNKDKRSFEIKRILKEKYPKNIFKVKIDKYSGGESINIYTNLFSYPQMTNNVWKAQFRRNDANIEEVEEYYKYKQKFEIANKLENDIKETINKYEKIDRDECTDEILSGGNTFIFIKGIEKVM